MSEQEKKRQRVLNLLNIYRKQNKDIFSGKRVFSGKSGGWRIEQKPKEGFLSALATAIKKAPTTSIRKHANEQKVHEKTVRIAIKHD